jgi:hypothetical protein
MGEEHVRACRQGAQMYGGSSSRFKQAVGGLCVQVCKG